MASAGHGFGGTWLRGHGFGGTWLRGHGFGGTWLRRRTRITGSECDAATSCTPRRLTQHSTLRPHFCRRRTAGLGRSVDTGPHDRRVDQSVGRCAATIRPIHPERTPPAPAVTGRAGRPCQTRRSRGAMTYRSLRRRSATNGVGSVRCISGCGLSAVSLWAVSLWAVSLWAVSLWAVSLWAVSLRAVRLRALPGSAGVGPTARSLPRRAVVRPLRWRTPRPAAR